MAPPEKGATTGFPRTRGPLYLLTAGGVSTGSEVRRGKSPSFDLIHPRPTAQRMRLEQPHVAEGLGFEPAIVGSRRPLVRAGPGLISDMTYKCRDRATPVYTPSAPH